MTRFAAHTEVSIDKSRADIERLITRYGAQHTLFANSPGMAIIAFEAHDRRVRFDLSIPDIAEFGVSPKGHKRKDPARQTAWQQECRRRWRSLALVIKAKLEAVDSKITTFEDEFLAHIMLPDGDTVGDRVRPGIAKMYASQTMQPLLAPPKRKALPRAELKNRS